MEQLKFRDIYDTYLMLEQAVRSVDRDREYSTFDSETKCRLDSEWELLDAQLYTLNGMSLDLVDIDLSEVKMAVDDCLNNSCIDPFN